MTWFTGNMVGWFTGNHGRLCRPTTYRACKICPYIISKKSDLVNCYFQRSI